MSVSNETSANENPRARGTVPHTILSVSLAALILAVYPFSNDPAGDVKYLITALAALALVVSLAIVAVRSATTTIHIGSCAPLLLLWLVVSLISAAQAQNSQLALVHCARFAALFALYFVTAQIVQRIADAEKLLRVLCAVAAIASLYGIVQYFGWDPLPGSRSAADARYCHAPATYGNPNLAGHVLVLIQIMLMYFAYAARARWVLYLAPLIVAHHAITGHRTGYLALGAALLLALVAKRVIRHSAGAPQRAVMKTIGVCGVVALIAFACIFGVQLLRANTAAPNDLSTFLRINSLWSAARMAIAYPLLGTGPGNFQIDNARYWSPFEQDWYATERKLNSHVHNDLLETAVETGALGAACHWSILPCIVKKLVGLLLLPHSRAAQVCFIDRGTRRRVCCRWTHGLQSSRAHFGGVVLCDRRNE